MIFVTVGSQKFQFNRLLKKIDKLIEEKIINEEVFAQTGYSDYEPINYEYKNFLDRDQFSRIMSNCDTVITHGGTGAIIGAVKQGKKVIAIPRLKEFNEHVDNHQLQIVREFTKMNFIKSVNEINSLDSVIKNLNNYQFEVYVSNTNVINNSIREFIGE